jgi:hypothetical protein
MEPQNESYSTYCRERAAECRRRADRAVARDVRSAFRDMEQMWLAAAERADSSYAKRDQRDGAEAQY